MKLLTALFLLLTGSFLFSQNETHFEIPELKQDESVISHFAYSISYNELNEQANWVAYELTDEETNSVIKRVNRFIVDPLVVTQSANNDDYSGSGYDRGHLAPAGDMGWSIVAMEESFYYSNMSPQDPGFNRGIWKRAEELVRNWAKEYRSVYVVTGPVLTDRLPTIGQNKVSVPKFYYKVILDLHEPHMKGIAFVMPNSGSTETLENFAISIDSVEKITGINFFPLLTLEQEKNMEGHFKIEEWNWNRSNQVYNGNESTHEVIDSSSEHNTNITNEHLAEKPIHHESENSSSVQCSGTTKKGARCKNITKNSSGKCHLH